jgi:IS1 family transposase/transposase-like protein
MHCPDCYSQEVVKNGYNATNKQMYCCKECGRQFVLDPDKSPISSETKTLIDKLLLERVPLAGIARVVGVSERWLQNYVNELYEQTPREVIVKKKTKGRLTIECDELWSYVKNKENKQWVWLAIDRDTREIIGVYIGDRSAASAKALWDSLPAVYRQCAVSYTDFWGAYAAIFPSKRHRAVGKETGHTSHIERLNCTLRQRISRLVRKTLSFSKKIANHMGAIWYFVHHYNACLPINRCI